MGIHLLQTIEQTSTDIRLLWFSVFVRMIAFGITNQVLTLYLKSLGISESKIGIFMSLTMIGDSILSYFLTWNANSFGIRRVMRIGSFLMFACGFVFASGIANFHILLTAAILGVISPSGDDTGPFKTIEEAVLAKLTPLNHRPEVYAVHGTLAAVGASFGNLFGGFFVQLLISSYHCSYRDAYRYSFFPFCFISIIKYITMLFMSYKCEPSYIPKFERKLIHQANKRNSTYSATEEGVQQQQQPQATCNSSSDSDSDSDIDGSLVRYTPEMEDGAALSTVVSHSSMASLGATETSSLLIQSTVEHPTITGLSPKSQSVLFKLLVPFMIDSLGFGFMPAAWVVYYFRVTFMPAALVLGLVFGCTNLIASVSAIPSAWFSKYFGPLRSTLLTQIPCGLFYMAIPIAKNSLTVSIILYLLNQATTEFDVVPRQIILTSLIDSTDLPKVMGTVNIGKQIARSFSPFFTGMLAEHGFLWVCFIISGGLLILANVILGVMFKGIDKLVAQKQDTNDEIE